MKKLSALFFIGILLSSCSSEKAETEHELVGKVVETEDVLVEKELAVPGTVDGLLVSDKNNLEEEDMTFIWDVAFEEYEGKSTESNIKVGVKNTNGSKMFDVCTLEDTWRKVDFIDAKGVSINIVAALKSFENDQYLVVDKTVTGTYDILYCKKWYDKFTLVFDLGDVENNNGEIVFTLDLPKESNKINEYGKSFPWPITD